MRVLVLTNMYPTSEQPAFGTFVKEQVDALEQAGIEIDVLFINGREHMFNYLGGVFRLWRMLLKRRYDVIHAHYAMSGFVARLQFLCPVVVTYHGSELADYAPAWLKFPARYGTLFFERIIVVNQQQKDVIFRHGKKVSVIPCGVDFNLFRPMSMAEARAALNLPPDIPLVLWVGDRSRYEKRFELMEAAMEILRTRCPEAELVLVSNQPHAVMPLYMNACDVLALTSLAEGSPMVIKEAMACNLPVVSTRVGDVPEIVAGVDGCYLVEPEAQDVADKLEQVLRQRRRTGGRERLRHLSSEAITQRVIEVYEALGL